MPNELWAAILGGALSLAGTLLTLFLQQRSQRNERKDIVTRFVIEQGEYLRELASRLEANFQKHSEVWMEDVDQIASVVQTFQRNLEHIVFIDDEAARRDIRLLFSDAFYISQRAAFWQRQVWDKKKLVSDGQLNAEEHLRAEAEVTSAFVEAKNCIVDLKQRANSIIDIKSSIIR